MKKLLCLFLNTTIFCSIYTGTNSVPAVQPHSVSYSFEHATVSLEHRLLDQTMTKRILTPADPPIFLKPDGTAEFFKSNHDALFHKGLWIGLAAGVGGTLMLFWVASYFFGNTTIINKTDNSVKEQGK